MNEQLKLSSQEQAELLNISPDYVRISMAAAIELGLKPGRIHGCGCGCINLLQNYPEGCFANCSYCGLARERPGLAEENSFIRVDWPLFSTDLIAEKIAEKEAESSVGRVCISQVQDHRANDDLIGITRKVHTAAPEVPLSGLVNATTMTVPFLEQLKEEGIDIIGYGLDAVTEELFIKTRGKEASGPHDWDYHWEMVRAARKIYGPLNVNCHLIVGLGETDQDMVNMFYKLKAEEIAGYLFSFNPEPGTTLQDQTRQPIQRHRRVQLAKYLIEEKDAERDVFQFDENGFITSIESEEELIQDTIDEGFPFMTNGCPDREGVMACNRPYGSYRPGEEFRDYPFKPTGDELNLIREQMQLNGELRAG
ncbi:MAG: radical SAM protein [Candidatus Marinimicrobia bacterium]|jgi:biotin synthase|nr:radical SAM protein [Candidatus Neomarinimicrobiota bacterium]MBT3497017.1 radical SAM protein [Candidatus Neomarinimicrobiota bacterium]MBT3692432.1 radical SAM protein [Candidatus Neomarinimicrobiota bacterium]MBT4144626.1 radical SAM protein [Candidatus Neomarinimicrobiota bacterium]MBT4178550.1 radical SAM protein [Candidatus Neomarinimicrobiota bacterium]